MTINNLTDSVFNYPISKGKILRRNLNLNQIKTRDLEENTPNLSSDRKTEQIVNKSNNSNINSPLNIQYDSTMNFFHPNNIINYKIKNYYNSQTEVPEQIITDKFPYRLNNTLNFEYESLQIR